MQIARSPTTSSRRSRDSYLLTKRQGATPKRSLALGTARGVPGRAPLTKTLAEDDVGFPAYPRAFGAVLNAMRSESAPDSGARVINLSVVGHELT
jgi:hypothetical protein